MESICLRTRKGSSINGTDLEDVLTSEETEKELDRIAKRPGAAIEAGDQTVRIEQIKEHRGEEACRPEMRRAGPRIRYVSCDQLTPIQS